MRFTRVKVAEAVPPSFSHIFLEFSGIVIRYDVRTLLDLHDQHLSISPQAIYKCEEPVDRTPADIGVL